MCFMKPPKMNIPAPQAVVPPPPPLTEELQGVEFGGQESETEKKGRKDMTIKRQPATKEKAANRQTRSVFKKNSAVDRKSS